MTSRQSGTLDLLEANARETGASLTVTDEPTPSGPRVLVLERFSPRAAPMYDADSFLWEIDQDGRAELIA